ncbi:MAG: fibronectin type III domain-containing protein [Kineosporiaceae bacterium]
MRSRPHPRSAALAVGAVMASLAFVPVGTSPAQAAGTIYITDLAGSISDNYGTLTGPQGVDKLIDNNPYSVYQVDYPTTVLRFTANADAVATGYSVTSGSGPVERDPVSWVFEGSADGTTWRQLDARTGQSFAARYALKTYSFANTTPYRRYRLRVTANGGVNATQVGEWHIIGTSSAIRPSPSAPSRFTATPRSADQIELSWLDNTLYEYGYRLERSTDGTTFTTLAMLPPGTTRYRDLRLPASTRFTYRVRASGTTDSAMLTASATTQPAAPAATWQEVLHKGDNTTNELMSYDSASSTADVVIYRDPDLAGKDLSSPITYANSAWRYVQRTYPFLGQQRLFLTMHDGAGIYAMAWTVDHSDTKYRQFIDAKNENWLDTWSNRNVLTHEMSHLVEDGGAPVLESPSYALWGDSKWAEIFQYDVYKGLGDQTEAQRWYNQMITQTDDFPRPGTMWFKNWFMPIYTDHGGTATLVKYIDLLSKNFHRLNGEYQRPLNWGEFVHFWSGAAGVNLQQLANTAFGASAERDAQFQQAKVDFPGVTYTG